MHNHVTVLDEISNFALYYAHGSAEKSVLSILLKWRIENSIDPDNSNLCQLKVFLISLQSLSYWVSTVIMLINYNSK